MSINNKINQLQSILYQLGKVTVAVSGGVDSMTLAFVAHRTLGNKAQMIHSVSSAVPNADTLRIKDYANQYGWQLECIHSGEMDDKTYRENPVNRCYFCKSCLYSKLKSLNFGQVVSGTNIDDLSDYRPGLIAAKENDIRHPFVEAAITKKMIRAIAHHYGLEDLSYLPASPCLASRVETGIYIQPQQLDLINRIETTLRGKITAENIRCRLQAQKLVLEVDELQLKALNNDEIENIVAETESMAREAGLSLPVHIAPYQRGSAFVGAV